MHLPRIVEANSLSSDLTHIASNPPKYPRNPTEVKRNPLTLYIARVPGSLDVILTTFKPPQEKSVTAEDVANSLYYLHLHTEEDARLLSEDATGLVEEDEPVETAQKQVPRKPLPESARSSFDFNRHDSALPAPLNLSNANRKIERKALPPDGPRNPPSYVEGKNHAQIRPLGPRPLFSDASIGRKPLPEAGVPPPPYASQVRLVASHSESTEEYSPKISESSNRSDYTAPKKTFSITVIRRDVTSGAQWNIGTVVGAREEQKHLHPSSKKGNVDLAVHLTNPGYTRFRDTQSNVAHATLGKMSSNNPTPASQQCDDAVSISEPGFHRQIRMEGSSFWDRPKRHKRSNSDMPAIRSMVARGRSGSVGSTEVDDSTDVHETGTKGYVFKSPWDGRCKFSTSSSGRALRCKHTLPPPVSASNVAERTSTSQVAVAVSELRFNLPSSAIFHSPTSPTYKGRDAESRRFHLPNLSHIRDKLSPEKVSRPPLPPRPQAMSYTGHQPAREKRPPLPPRPYSYTHTESSDDNEAEPPPLPGRTRPYPYASRSGSEDEDAKIDLRLGQENAGGGSKGKRVKLGKLIIMDEGLKMLDLIVAANMGVWWSVYESAL